ncbi:alpha/beta fold hydrolase [Bdellovibrio sp. HCB274]|uniref:alpha/beta fold hydrolase n=1 Tax=Bdellovibrio sp. HCB274 TaxID=3394361 RepID=UPI0039B47359
MNSSQPIVMIPGLVCTPRLFEAQIPALWQFGPVMVADHRKQASIPEIAKSILANAPPKFTLLGLSMGGYISFEIMRQAPERVAKLILMNTSARPDTPEQTTARNTAIAQTQSGNFKEAMEASLKLIFRDYQNPELRKVFLQMSEETGAEQFIGQQRAIMGRIDSRPYLKDIKCPTLIIAAEDDVIIPPPVMKEIADGIAGSKFVLIPNCGHTSTLEQPKLTTQALVEWLKELR